MRPGAKGTCDVRESLCAPCGAALAGPCVALTFAYDYFEVAELDGEFEVPSPSPACMP